MTPFPYHAAAGFPYYVTLWGRRIHPHVLFELLAYFVGFRLYLYQRRRFGDTIPAPLRWAALAAAVAGAALGSKVLFLLEDPQFALHHLHDFDYLTGGKTIVGALVFGLAAVETAKHIIGLKQSTGDLYAIPIAAGIAIGRVGCFLTGLSDNTCGTPSKLPWAVDFGDGVRRHPTQIYEIVLLLVLIPVLYWILRAICKTGISGVARAAPQAASRPTIEAMTAAAPQSAGPRFQAGDAFKLFMVAYLLFRLLCDFIKPYPRIFLGLGGIQWACVLVLVYYFRDVLGWMQIRYDPATGAWFR
jgi:prolipoprotein diacylglyceryltransferase